MSLGHKHLAKNQVWNTRSISTEFYGSATPSNIKKSERWLSEKRLDFPLLKDTELKDEHDRKSKVIITEQIVQSARKKRKIILFASICADTSGKAVLFANDARNGRRWIFLDTKAPKHKDIQKKLELLALEEEKDTVIFPTGSLVARCRTIARAWRSNETKLGNSHRLRLALEIYSHSYNDIYVHINEKLRQKPSDELTHLDRLEAESIHIIREVMADANNPVMLYSIGKDSSVMLHLARKAFYPNPPPFPLLHIDTCWKFQAMYDFRENMARKFGMELLVHINPQGLEKNINPFDHGSAIHTEIMKTQSLKMAIDHYKFDVAFGGARRDEEKSRAKERIFSFRKSSHLWDPKHQRPELWKLYNGLKNSDESIRVFPISNWTEPDVWQYIYREQIPIVPLYFAAERPVVDRDGMIMMVDDDRLKLNPKENIQLKKIRFRTLGCYPLTGAIRSEADSLASIVLEILNARTSERQGRLIDTDTRSSMEKKKQEGYF
ncbi:sulfate adenylyltransferase subunit CysD [Alphaproteobacteria bacterium]|nr:sulfate adenylyltransferase subunit CysD [Alphaproteobacteria bacterium]